MSRVYTVAIVLAAAVLTGTGCGGSASRSSQKPASAGDRTRNAPSESHAPAVPLTRAQLIAQGDAICFRLNVKRSTTKITRRGDYERLIPPLAAYELAAAAEMGRLIPPASMAHDWRQIVAAARMIADTTGHYHSFTEAEKEKPSGPLDTALSRAIKRMVKVAKDAGFKDCARFE